MSSPKFLEYEVVLLLAKYGKSTVLHALAQKINVTPEELETLLQKLPTSKSGSSPSKKPSAQELVGELAQAHPEKANMLRTLHGRFENRSFLPELRDVKRFFEQRTRTLGATKSRVEALPKLLRLLSELPVSELESFCHSKPEGTYSSLGIISDEILRRDK